MRQRAAVLPATGAVLVAVLVGGCVSSPGGDPVTPPEPTSAPPVSASPSNTASPTASTPTLPTGVPGPPTVLVADLDVPWSVAELPDGGALMSLRDRATIVRMAPGGAVVPVVAPGPEGTVPEVVPGGEGGLLGLALDPDDPTSLFVYATRESDNAVTRWTLDGESMRDPVPVVTGIPKAGNHNGGRLAFGPDGFLYVATGDAQNRDNAQDPGSLGGKILRITRDGAPAPGNPFPGSPVWTLGHRNVQGLGWAADGAMYASEFGQNRLDELNLIQPGSNYGWPHTEGSDGEGGFVDPLVTWSTGEASPSGLLVTGDAVYLAALRGERLWRVPLVGPGQVGPPEAYLSGQLGRLRDVVLAPSGRALWVLTNNTARGDPAPDDDKLVELALG